MKRQMSLLKYRYCGWPRFGLTGQYSPGNSGGVYPIGAVDVRCVLRAH